MSRSSSAKGGPRSLALFSKPRRVPPRSGRRRGSPANKPRRPPPLRSEAALVPFSGQSASRHCMALHSVF